MNGVVVFLPGTAVLMDQDIRACVAQVSIRERGAIQYQVTWWDSRRRQCEWVEPHEIRPMDASKELRVGFIP